MLVALSLVVEFVFLSVLCAQRRTLTVTRAIELIIVKHMLALSVASSGRLSLSFLLPTN